jgi:L-cysteine desulfidase
MGCTEPIAVAFAAAKARQVLGTMPEKILIRCSANIIKNVKGVTVPNTGGLKGIDTAAIAGIVSDRADANLEVLAGLTEEDIAEIRRLKEPAFASRNWLKASKGCT